MKLFRTITFCVTKTYSVDKDNIIIDDGADRLAILANEDAEQGTSIDNVKIGCTVIIEQYRKPFDINTCSIEEFLDTFVTKWHIA